MTLPSPTFSPHLSKWFPWNVVVVNVTVSDLGDLIENVQLTVQAVNKTAFTVGTGSTYLAGGTSKTFTFYRNASAASSGRYTIVASVPLVRGETVGAGLDNTLRYKSLAVLYPGDLNKDGRVIIIDAGMMGAAFYSRPGYPNWNPDADIEYNLWVNIIDFGILAANYGKSNWMTPALVGHGRVPVFLRPAPPIRPPWGLVRGDFLGIPEAESNIQRLW